MKTKHLPYHLGIVIPCCLILLNGGTTFYSSIKYESEFTQKCFWGAYFVVWLTYAQAIFTSPGFTGGLHDPAAQYIECRKCGLPKPERAHHCKQCGRCVLRMDHHCPWTENCVGFRNLPHFLRFLSSAILLNAYGVFKTAAFLIYAFEHRRHLSYFVPNKARVWVAGLAVASDLFVMLTLLILWLRVVMDVLNGETQIENWEKERVETLARRKMGPQVDFPFDVDIFTNLRTALGELYEWPLPWGLPSGTGHSFPRLVETEQRWPPADNKDVNEHEYYRADRWVSFDGDNVADFGVDLSADKNISSGDSDLTSPQDPALTSEARISNDDEPLLFVQRRSLR